MEPSNPCLTCGACCAYFRVSFYWGEADPAQGGTIPPDLTEELTSFRRCMQGTNQSYPRCAALLGDIGSSVRCTIYEDRPSPCREFGMDWTVDGLRFTPDDLARCTQARAAWGLLPLFDSPAHNPFEKDPPSIGKAS